MEIIGSIRSQNMCQKYELMNCFIPKLEDVIESIPDPFNKDILPIIDQIYGTIENKDDVLLADFLENLLTPFLCNILENGVTEIDISLQKVKLSNDLTVELTSSGNYTMCFKGIYFHSNVSPDIEALQLANYWDEPTEKVCLVWGLGLGYHILKLLEKDTYRIVYVFEPEKEVIEAYQKYGVRNQIDSIGRAKIFYDPSGNECAKYTKQYCLSKLNIHYPTLEVMPEGELKDSFKKYYTAFSSTKHQKRSYFMSFRENTNIEFKGLPELVFDSKAYRAIIVSAGPSLDKNYQELINVEKDTIIIATAPTMGKLYKAGIVPDCVVISDTDEICKKFHKGAEEAVCPLVFSSTASIPFVAEHKGPKYILCPEGFEPAERLAKEKGWPVLKSFGSVALTALALAIYKGFKEIVFVGQDLCYKGKQMHAEGTATRFLDYENNRSVLKDINNEDVTVSNDLALFKTQIEITIQEHPEIRFLNATEGGLHIKGTKDIKLNDLF